VVSLWPGWTGICSQPVIGFASHPRAAAREPMLATSGAMMKPWKSNRHSPSLIAF
jgi:hypothetical protein